MVAHSLWVIRLLSPPPMAQPRDSKGKPSIEFALPPAMV